MIFTLMYSTTTIFFHCFFIVYEKVLKNKTPKNKTWYEKYKNIFETIKRKSIKYYISK